MALWVTTFNNHSPKEKLSLSGLAGEKRCWDGMSCSGGDIGLWTETEMYKERRTSTKMSVKNSIFAGAVRKRELE